MNKKKLKNAKPATTGTTYFHQLSAVTGTTPLFTKKGYKKIKFKYE